MLADRLKSSPAAEVGRPVLVIELAHIGQQLKSRAAVQTMSKDHNKPNLGN